MMAPRRAVPGGAARNTALRGALTVTAAGFAAVAAVSAAVSVRMARRIVTPGGRVADTDILDVDTSAQTITLRRTPDTALPGRYGLFTTGTSSYVKLGTVLSSDTTRVTRKLLTEVDEHSRLSAKAAFSGWYFDHPDQLHLPYRDVQIDAPIGRCPAWLFPAPDDSSHTWVIQVHGRGTTRAECLRAVPLFHAAGVTSLLVSYRNDGDAPRSRAGTYALGLTEWRDVDAAITYALRNGARRVLLMGWSMGGAITLQLSLNSAHRERIAGLVLESPVVDWRIVLGYHARQLRVPAAVAGLAMGTLERGWTRAVTGADTPIRFDRLDLVARAAELRHPMLILHSDDDGFVPSDASHGLAAARPDLVELETFSVARHTKLWNYDPQRWEAAITSWLERHIAAEDDRGGV